MKTETTETKQKPDLSKRFKPGQSGNPAGRPKGTPNAQKALLDVIRQVETDKKRPIVCSCAADKDGNEQNCATLREHLVRQSFVDPKIASAAWKKLDPDLQHQTGQKVPSSVKVTNHYYNQESDKNNRIPSSAYDNGDAA